MRFDNENTSAQGDGCIDSLAFLHSRDGQNRFAIRSGTVPVEAAPPVRPKRDASAQLTADSLPLFAKLSRRLHFFNVLGGERHFARRFAHLNFDGAKLSGRGLGLF